MNYGWRFVTLYRRQGLRPSQEKKCKKAKWLSEEALQIAVKRREVKNRFKGLGLIECLMNFGQRFVTLYRRQGLRPSPWKRNESKVVV